MQAGEAVFSPPSEASASEDITPGRDLVELTVSDEREVVSDEHEIVFDDHEHWTCLRRGRRASKAAVASQDGACRHRRLAIATRNTTSAHCPPRAQPEQRPTYGLREPSRSRRAVAAYRLSKHHQSA